MDQNGPVVVARAPNPTVAGMWQEVLQRVGIPVMVRNRDVAGGLYGAPPLPFSCELVVAKADELAARTILDDLGAATTP
jgi:hypothetical protein